MPPVAMIPQQGGQVQQPSVWEKMKMGGIMGGTVGLCIGFLFGGTNILRQGAGPRGFLPALSGYMLTSAATFGFFMSIGSVIRTDGLTMAEWAEREVQAGRWTPALSVGAGGNGRSAAEVIKERERRKSE
ncbi:mitochondrial genome maintenance protein [Pseudohyphozyma bogoriensis]|nr:mitochondrial genome maintenance protein [Pseudohyphozyma bogoriensis]